MPFNRRVNTPSIAMLLSNIPALVGNVSTVGGSLKKKGEEYSPCGCKRRSRCFHQKNKTEGENAEKLCEEYCLKTLPNAMLQIKVPRATPSNVKDREMFKRDEVAISRITSEAENVFSAQLHSIQIHLKRLKLTMGMY